MDYCESIYTNEKRGKNKRTRSKFTKEMKRGKKTTRSENKRTSVIYK